MIGKTRQGSPARKSSRQNRNGGHVHSGNESSGTGDSKLNIEKVFDPALGKPRGILGLPPAAGKFRHSRRSPSPALSHCIEHYWSVSWDLRGLEPHVQETLPHPNIYVVFENSQSTIAGVSTEKFSRVLEGRSYVFGVKFKPGGFRPFLKSPVASLTNRTVPARRIFGKDMDALDASLLSSYQEDSPGKEEERIAATDAFFLARAPEPDETVALAGQLVARILQESEIKTVDDLVVRAGIGKRSLQRFFNEYVGINPKWVIRRYRLHELVARLQSGEPLEWAQLALDLGYFDQAHLINDFRSIAGYSPAQYQTLASTKSEI